MGKATVAIVLPRGVRRHAASMSTGAFLPSDALGIFSHFQQELKCPTVLGMSPGLEAICGGGRYMFQSLFYYWEETS